MRHASRIAAVLLVASLSAAAVAVWVDRMAAVAALLFNDPLSTASELVCFGAVGAVLIARRPDLPFGWILGVGALADIVLVGIGVPSLVLANSGRGGQLVIWGVGLGVLQWVPAALEGIVNVRFPSGRPSTRVGYWLDRALWVGIPVVLVGNYLGHDAVRSLEDGGVQLGAERFVDGTWVTPVGDAALVLVPLLILLGVLAGIGVIVRCFRATGIERKQLQWRAAGAALSLAFFPLVVSGVWEGADAVEPLIFCSTLLIPMLRYQLWSGDPIPRRRRVPLLVSRRTLVETQEEERRRLRRDLHDGLGPLLTGLRLNLDAVQAQLERDPEKALEHLATAREASAEVISDLRGLVYGLRPPALDELGLAGSLRVQLASLGAQSTVEITLEVEESPGLPAAVEVAVYRTATEGVTNVLRHSSAQHCRVRIADEASDVVLTVDDDGQFVGPWRPGIGLTSLRERAVELGGSFLASSGPDGFHLAATYPRT